MTEKDIRNILKMETELPEKVDSAVEDVLKEICMGDAKKNAIKKRPMGKRKWTRMILPAAAVIVLSTGVLAAGISLFWKDLTEKGVTEADTEKLIVTKPDTDTENLEDAEYNGVKPREKKWEQPMLSVEEAYFDGTSLHFLASPSEEAGSYDLTCRDHASINGMEAVAQLSKVQDENLYYGKIDIWNAEDAGKVSAGASEVLASLTVQAYPRYEGRIYYTWCDSEAYGEIFDIGAFVDEQGKQCYVLPVQDTFRGYTPQKLSLNIPLNEEVKEIIEKYRSEGKLVNDTIYEQSDMEDETDTAAAENADADEAENTEPPVSDAKAVIEENHVTASFAGKDGVLSIDAVINRGAVPAQKGTIEDAPLSEADIMALFGDSEGWEPGLEQTEEIQSWKNEAQSLYASWDRERKLISFESKAEAAGEITDDMKGLARWNEILEKAGLEGITELNPKFVGMLENVNYYMTQFSLEGIPVAQWSQRFYNGSMQLEHGELVSYTIPTPFQVKTREEASLLSLEEIMVSINAYMQAGKIMLPQENNLVTEINLEYYIDETAQGTVYRPVWNFQVESWTEEIPGPDVLFYIDGETGALVWNVTGWGW